MGGADFNVANVLYRHQRVGGAGGNAWGIRAEQAGMGLEINQYRGTILRRAAAIVNRNGLMGAGGGTGVTPGTKPQKYRFHLRAGGAQKSTLLDRAQGFFEGMGGLIQHAVKALGDEFPAAEGGIGRLIRGHLSCNVIMDCKVIVSQSGFKNGLLPVQYKNLPR